MSRVLALIALCLVAVSFAVPLSEDQYAFMFRKFITQHNKDYHHDEFHVRFSNFKNNVDLISEHNNAGKSWKMAVNSFADLTSAEFKAKYLGYKFIDNSYLRSKNVVEISNVSLPTSIDWVAKGAVTAVKNQGQCGSCWAFSTTGSLEGAYQIAKGALVSFSEQQLVDCSQAQGNQGCNGGLMDQGFAYIQANGICTEDAYPYTAADGTCASSKCTSVTKLRSWTDVAQNSEDALQAAAAQQPVSVAIEADQSSFQFYTSGVYSSSDCGTTLDHGVLVVGYGTMNGQLYWKVKNSWGASWGSSGYIYILRGTGSGKPGLCGIAMQPSYPNM